MRWMSVRGGAALGLLCLGSVGVRAEEVGSLSLRVPEAERVVSLRAPAQVEIETTLPEAIVSLFVDGRPVMVSNRPKTQWRLDPERWLKGSATRRLKLHLVAYPPGGAKVERTLFVHLGGPPTLFEP